VGRRHAQAHTRARSGFGIFSSCALIFLLCVASSRSALADPVDARHKQGSGHGFLLLKSPEGKIIAVGDEINIVNGNEVHSRLVFHFRDGSIDDEVTVFRQTKVLQLITDHHIQRGPSFPQPVDITINVPRNEVTWYQEKDGKHEVQTDHMDMPPDLANGMLAPLIENFPRQAAEVKVSYIAGDPKPRIVKLSIKPDGRDTFRIGGVPRPANRFNLHIEIGGVAGVIAPVIGKQPSDIQIWAMDGEIPTFLKMVGALYDKGPTWTAVLTSPEWPRQSVH
jgi:hypothetical protein